MILLIIKIIMQTSDYVVNEELPCLIESHIYKGYEYEAFMRFGKGGIAGVFLVRLQKIQDSEDE